jgi:hypothetical protein
MEKTTILEAMEDFTPLARAAFRLEAEEAKKRDCPYCGQRCECDWVDVGVVGEIPCGPYVCSCGASSIGAFDGNECTPEEVRCGWYAPGRPVSDKANTYNGEVVDHVTARELHRRGLLDPKGPKR